MQHEDNAAETETWDRNVLFDVDTPSDYDELRTRWEKYDIPTPEECEILLKSKAVSEKVIRHCRAVTKVADALGQALIRSGESLDPDLIHAAALLHDIAKGQRDHGPEGGRMLREMASRAWRTLFTLTWTSWWPKIQR